jgi:hypothetical protein
MSCGVRLSREYLYVRARRPRPYPRPCLKVIRQVQEIFGTSIYLTFCITGYN